MKTLKSSDISPMAFSTTNYGAVCLAMPVSTSAMWGMNVFQGRNATILGTRANRRTNPPLLCNAIWGTCGLSMPPQPARKPNASIEIHC